MKIGFIGAGKMGEAMVQAFLASKAAQPHEVSVTDISEERRHLMKDEYGVNVYARAPMIPDKCDLLFLAVKPQQMEGVLTEIAPLLTKKHIAVSIAAGRKVAWLEERLPEASVVRVMPNLGCLVGESMSVFCAGSRTRASDKQKVARLLNMLGRAVELPEDQFDAVTALSGSGPAFFARFLQHMVVAGEQLGLPRTEALLLAQQTMLGTAKVLMTKQIDPAELVKSVTSPNGTTAAGLAVFDEAEIGEIVFRTLQAACRRSRELG